jgi:hypothetical protein
MCSDPRGLYIVAALALTSGGASATTVPFTEDFASGPANWFNAPGTQVLAWETTGGPDGGSFVSTPFSFVGSQANDTPVLFRGQDEFGSSGGAFVGNWLSDGVTQFAAMVRHDGVAPLNFFARFSSPFNFPGATAVSFIPVMPNQWTPIIVPIDPSNPQFVSFEGSDFGTVFSNIGHVQIGVSVPAGLAGATPMFNFGLDKVSIVPEPATVGLLLAGIGAAAMRRARRPRR